MTESAAERAQFPYLSFETFRNFITSLSGGRPLPPRIDRSLMIGMAGGTQGLLIGALQTFGLINEKRVLTPRFIDLVQVDVDSQKKSFAFMLQELYPEQMRLAREHATADQLIESFKTSTGYNGSTLRKAVTFFLNMAKFSDVELSPFFRAPVQAQTRLSRPIRRTRSAEETASSTVERVEPPSGPTPVETKSAELASGGTITISCTVSFLNLSRIDRDFVFDLVDRLDEYASRQDHRGASAEA